MEDVIQQRKIEEIEALKQKILDTTLDLAISDGWESVTIRKISQKIRYSSPVIYRHFKNKQDIIAQLYLRGLKLLKSYLEGATIENNSPAVQMEQGVLGYWNFALEHPELYHLMFSSKASEYTNDELDSFGHELFEGGIEMIGKLNQSLSFDEKHDFLANYFSLLHGYVHLALNDRLYTKEGGRKDAKSSLQRAISRLVRTISQYKN